jgi:hypothetical protein
MTWILTVLLAAGVASGQPAPEPAAEEAREAPALLSLRAWLDARPEGERLDAEAREQLEEAVAETEDPLESALRLLRPSYGAALDLLETDGEEAALPALRRLTKEPPDETTGAYARYRLAEALLLLERTEDGEAILGQLMETRALRGTAAERSVVFLRAFAWARMDRKVDAFRLFRAYLETWPEAPERYRALARQILRELESEYRSPLLDVSGKMKDAARLLDRIETGEPTQKRQAEVVALLEQLIELAEKMEKAGQGSGGGAGGAGGRAGGNNSNSPADDSFLPTGPTEIGRLRRVSRGDPDEVWGELRDRDREEALQFLKDRFPTRYRELLEEYYRALSEGR